MDIVLEMKHTVLYRSFEVAMKREVVANN